MIALGVRSLTEMNQVSLLQIENRLLNIRSNSVHPLQIQKTNTRVCFEVRRNLIDSD